MSRNPSRTNDRGAVGKRPSRRTAPRRLRSAWAALAFLAGAASAQSPPPEAAPPALDAAARLAIVDSVTQALNEGYVFADVAKAMEKHVRTRQKRGAYDAIGTIPEFAQALTEDLRSISHDKHLRVLFLPPEAPGSAPGVTDEERERRQAEEARRRNFGFQSVARLEGNVGYLDLRNFFDAKYAGGTAIAAMNFLANVDALIVDLRQNGGGEPNMIQLLSSYLFDRTTHLNSFQLRAGDKLHQFWTQSYVPGPSLSGVPVWVLTSSFTFSGAEEFAYNLQSYKRGTIVGEVTGGGAHPVMIVRFPSLQVGVGVPFGRAVNPNTGTNWEGVGVKPDIEVPADQALDTAHREALRKLRDAATDAQRTQSLDWTLAGIEARAKKVVLDAAALSAYVGVYGPRRITLENGVLHYQREGRPRMTLIPAGDDLFLLEGMDGFRARFGRDASGRIDRIIGLYEDGRNDENPRTEP